MTQSIRMAHKAMADSRAMEEQMERENPLDGSGATPSMGLSQIRGGAMAHGKALSEHLHSLHGSAYANEFCRGMNECGGLGTGRFEGQGAVSDIGHKLSDMLPENYAKFGHFMSDMSNKYLGLGNHMKGGWLGLAALALPLISKLLGAGKMTKEAHDMMAKMIKKHEKKYHSGKMEGGSWLNLLTAALPVISNLLGSGQMTKGAADQLKKMMKNGEKMEGAGRCVGAGTGGAKRSDYGKAFSREEEANMVFEPEDAVSMARGPKKSAARGGMNASFWQKVAEQNAKNPSFGKPIRDQVALPTREMMGYGTGAGIFSNLGHGISDVVGMFGLGHEEAPMKAKKAKRVVSATDGRRKRAEIVKQVMADKGMKMIDASRYVKENNLY